MKQNITEEQGIHKEWYIQAKEQTIESLPGFISHLMNDYGHDYGTICHALAAGGIATMWAMNKHGQGGITGFQSGAVMWEFIRNWNHAGNKTGLKLVDYDNLLYPQYEGDFEKTISSATWRAVQDQAKTKLENTTNSHPHVKSHWESIKAGKLPFGFKIKEE